MKKYFYLVFLLAMFYVAETYSQVNGRQSSFNRDKLYWTAWDYSDGGIPKSFYDSAKFNTVIRQAKAGTINNLGELTQFQNIFAANTNAQEWEGNIYKVDEQVQLDWLYAVTGGYYNEFYAARADDYELAGETTNQEFCLERGTDYFGDKKTININAEDKICFSSGINEAYKDKILLRGPHYYQHKGYELHSQEMERPITYKVKFIIYPGELTNPINPQYNAPCVRVSVYYTDTVRQFPYDQSAPLMTRVYRLKFFELNASGLMNNPNLQLSYNYKNDVKDSNIIIERAYINNEKLGTEFVVEWLGNAEIFVEKVEVWDQDIWGQYGKNGLRFDEFKTDALDYVQLFNNNIEFKNKLRGWQSLNEPHTVDLLRSFRFVDSLCALPAPDGFNTAPMFTMFYPNWDNSVDGRDFLKQIIEIAQPNPLFYWYYPFNVGETDISGLYYFQTYALRSTALWLSDQSANKYYPSKDWYYTAQAWGYRKSGTNEYYRWRRPTGQALRASIFAALAYGCKGIFIEPFDSYMGDQSANGYITEGLLEYIEPVPETPRWNTLGLFVKDSLGERMSGILSSRLSKLEYESPDDIVTIRTNFAVEELREGEVYEGDIANASAGNITVSEDTYDSAIPASAIRNYFVVSRLKRNSKHPYQSMPYQGVLMVNLITETEPNAEHRKLRLTIDNPWTGVNNVVLRNVEKPAESYYFHNSLERSFLLYKGDAKLFDLAPVVHIGGDITADETINERMELIENDLIINSDAELTVNSVYECNKNIIINAGATVTVNGTGKIKFKDGARLVCYGKLVINGGEIDFSSPIANNCVMVQEGAELIINGGRISNGRYGINLSGKATVKVNNATISNCQDAVLLFDFGARIPYITGCNISGCINGITAINGESVVIKDNTITTSGGYGITLDLISQPHIIRNTITDVNSGASYSGIFSLLSGGYYRQNNISNYGIGILLSESMPYLFGNTITNNYLFGLYNGPGSSAVMMPLTVYNGSDASSYSFGGNNTIMNNGYGFAPYTVSSPEIHITSSVPPEMNCGYNNIVDDREPPYGETSLLLESSEQTLDIKAEKNFWGSMDFTYRFSNLNVSTGDYLSVASGYELNPNVYLVLSDTSGQPIDTVYAVNQVEGSLPTGGEMFGIAEALAAEGNYSAAAVYYEQMLAQWPDSGYILKAASRLLFVKKMLNEDTQQLEAYLTQKSNETNDENLRIALEYIKSLSQLSREEYGSASEVVAGIINGLPGTERGIYAEIDSVLIGIIASANAQTNAPGKANVVKDKPEIGDPNRLLSGYLKNKYGIGPRQETQKIIPEVLNLLQNYPNPFGRATHTGNPSTQIVYQIPKESEVMLKVYDLLGREIATLVNEKKQPGEYTITFDGKKMASGIYLYELRAGEFRSIRKMILVR